MSWCVLCVFPQEPLATLSAEGREAGCWEIDKVWTYLLCLGHLRTCGPKELCANLAQQGVFIAMPSSSTQPFL